ncbi:hypothetical protein P4603_05370 [Priestia aryabhattai]|nr:hypothetical protein [Priestia aryabhattai]
MNKPNLIYQDLNKVKIDIENYVIYDLTAEEKDVLKKKILKKLKL